MNRMLALLTVLILITATVDARALERPLINTPSRRMLPEARPVVAWSDWATCQKAAIAGTAQAIATWQSQSILKDVIINGTTATGGSISGPPLQPFIQMHMFKYGIPADVVNAFATPVSNAWNTWTSSLRIPSLQWYPSFACYPGPMAPPTPNIPMPLAVLSSNPEPISAISLKTSIRSALGARASDPRALAAVDGFVDSFTSRLAMYRANTMITNVMGTGPVPTYAPPYGPKCGPVVNGRAIIKTGAFTGFWPAY